MKDLDFDELDRAVNSLITSPSGPTGTEAKDKTLEIEAGPTEQLLADSSNNSQPTTSTASPIVARRSTGRFMDVVPPSSNTRVTPSAPERISREGLTINPADKSLDHPDTTDTPAPAVTPPTTSTSDWPDPIDFHKPDNTVADKPENEDADIDQISNDITDTLNQGANESAGSPFISGTKVEKRPLGAFSAEAPDPVTKPSIPETTPVKPIDTSPVDVAPTNLATPLPAELHEDLLSIESGESGSTKQPNEPSTTEVSDAAHNVPATPVTDNQSVSPTSITQQYKEQPSSGDQSSGAIYDTDAYHKALSKPAKKKSSWMWVIWIAILLVVGAGAGAAVYFLVLPRL